MHHKIRTMLELQDTINQRVHPQWRTQGHQWYRAIWVECAELMEHYGWKWWKQQTPDRDQVVLELVDIWHFGLSDLLESGTDHADLAQEIAGYFPTTTERGDFLSEVESFAAQVLSERRFDVGAFARLMGVADLSMKDLYVSYIGKNVLNFFRQDHGYKLGQYRKVWQGREDNEHLMDLLRSLDANSLQFKDEIYQGLKGRYVASS